MVEIVIEALRGAVRDAAGRVVIDVAQRHLGEIDLRTRQAAQPDLAGIEAVGVRIVLCRRERGHAPHQIRELADILLLDILLAERRDRQRDCRDALFAAPGGDDHLFDAAVGCRLLLIGLCHAGVRARQPDQRGRCVQCKRQA
jgi:hypothetical protein